HAKGRASRARLRSRISPERRAHRSPKRPAARPLRDSNQTLREDVDTPRERAGSASGNNFDFTFFMKVSGCRRGRGSQLRSQDGGLSRYFIRVFPAGADVHWRRSVSPLRAAAPRIFDGKMMAPSCLESLADSYLRRDAAIAMGG